MSTIHTTNLRASGRAYVFWGSEALPVSDGDQMALFCAKNSRGGYQISGFVNRSDGTYQMPGRLGITFAVWLAVPVSFVVGAFAPPLLLVTLVSLAFALRETFRTVPRYREGKKALRRIASAQSKSEIEEVLVDFSGRVVNDAPE